MTVNNLIAVSAAILLGVLLFFEKRENQKRKLVTKTVLSCLFVFTAIVQPHSIPGYFYFLLIGLLFCLGGDVFLALPQEKAFLLGLVSFLLGHVFYIFSFFYVAELSAWTWIGAIVGVVFSGAVFFWLRPHLGSMLIPVIAYMIVITIMVVGSWSVLGEENLNLSGRLLVFFGALSFYLSDLFVARDRFVKEEFSNRLLGLPMYYVGQFLLAFSVAAMR